MIALLVAAAVLLAGDAAANEVSVQFGPEALLGPFALLVGALIAVGVLWREDRRVYKERIADLREQRDLANLGWKAQTDANEALVAENATLARTNETNARTNEANAAILADNAKILRSLSAAANSRARADSKRRRLADRSE